MLANNDKADVPLIVVMGVAGSGKSTIAAGLAEKLGVDFIEGDSLHPQANVLKMASGHPLTDEDRWPWLEAIGDRIEAERAAGPAVVGTGINRPGSRPRASLISSARSAPSTCWARKG